MYTKNFKLCTRCGGKLALRPIEGKQRLQCPDCEFIQYLNPTPAVGVCLAKEGKILLVQRAVGPKQGLWQVPAGFLEVDEDVKDGAIREIKEETALDVELEALLGVYSAFDDPRYVCLLVMYRGKITAGTLTAQDDAADARFFDPNDLPPIAFESHKQIIADFFAGKSHT